MVVLDHLHTTNNLPFTLETTWAPSDRFERLPEVYAVTGHLDQAFAQLGVKGFRSSKWVISCRAAEPDELTHLGLRKGAVVIVLAVTYVDSTDEPVCYSVSRYAADRIDFVIES
jgi:GntR family phosphonate transport system transcriptional regulator